jgi:GTP-binding protein
MSGRVVSAAIVATATAPRGFPAEGLPEVAFLGRSNSGKSSLLNALVGRRELARISATPGKTRAIHFYRIEREAGARGARRLLLVDLPGYGYARVSKSERAGWRALVEGYLDGRAPLRAAVLLQDVRRDVSDEERDLIAWLDARRIPTLVALTKCDKLKPGARMLRVRALERAHGLAAGRVVATSSREKLGVDALWRALDALLAPG